MRATVSFGRICGIRVGAHWSALVGVMVLGDLLAVTVLPVLVPGRAPAAYLLAGAVAALVLVLSLLAHELAHALVARRAGLGVRRITLWLLGGVSELEQQPARAAAEIRIALVGPLTSLALAGLFAGVARATTWLGAPALIGAVLSWLATVNVMLGVFNMLPGSPLDGGRVLHGVIWWALGDRERATRAAAGAGQILGGLLAGLGIFLVLKGRPDGLWLLLVGGFLGFAAGAERVHGVLAESVQGLTAADVMSREPALAEGWWTVQALIDRLVTPDSPRYRVFPVIDFSGRPVGVLRLTDLAAVDPASRFTTTVQAVARPLPSEHRLDAETPLEQVLERPIAPGRDVLVVEQDGRVVGVITSSDLQRTVELQALRRGSGPTASRGGSAERG
jgi:Zn-dependent protease/predicted transcriptional regulator